MNAIERLRKKRGMTQTELAAVLGVSQANISMWESGEALPRTDKLPALARILNCTIDELFADK